MEFESDVDIRVVRCNIYPIQDPQFYVVAFDVKCKTNNRSKYFETTVPMSLSNGKDDLDIVKLGWKNVKRGVNDWFDRLACKRSLIGATLNSAALEEYDKVRRQRVDTVCPFKNETTNHRL
jgi:hypothetical protein